MFKHFLVHCEGKTNIPVEDLFLVLEKGPVGVIRAIVVMRNIRECTRSHKTGCRTWRIGVPLSHPLTDGTSQTTQLHVTPGSVVFLLQ